MISIKYWFTFLLFFILVIKLKADPTDDCRNSIFGCCPDGVTPAEGQNYENCGLDEASCHISEFGCCSDNLTPARGPNLEGCNDQSCENSLFGCCPDKKTVAKTEDKSDCPKVYEKIIDYSYNLKSCSESEFECCPDGLTPANGPNFKDCAEDGSLIQISNQKINKNICDLPEPELECSNYTLKWRYDMERGRCVQYWSGGCNFNENVFQTFEECESRCVNPPDAGICELPPVSPSKLSQEERCQKNYTRYYYDASSASCKTFIYSGCYGNHNNFLSLDECDRKCQLPLLFEKCSFIPDKGPCRGDHERWFFDSRIGQCKTFSYGGCMVTKNNHLSETDCFNSCVRPKQKNVCLLPKIVGNCDEKIDSWYYDFKEGKCNKMLYSGCNGNLNRFETKEACEYTCQGLVDYPKQKITEDICLAPKVLGSCHIKLQRWFYNSTTEMCEQFTYSGCDGSSNNFESESDCRTTCNAKIIDPCELPMDSGTCGDYKVYWYYNNIDKECSRFYYGGCDGNLNRFDSKASCEIDCKLSPEEKSVFLKLSKKCLEPVDQGNNCSEVTQKWYFNTETKMCYSFEYSGCGPELSNRFDSDSECSEACVVDVLNPIDQTEVVVTSTVAALPDVHIDTCNLPLEEGNCSQAIPKWYYDTNLKYCLQFNFTGCNGNENRFENRHQCAEICEIPRRKEICYSNKAQGPCDQFQSRWYYDPETQSCKDFHYGGCLGNDNNFHSIMECKNFCWDYLSEESRNEAYVEFSQPILTTTEVQTITPQDICSLEKAEGNCDDKLVRWYHDSNTKECLKFTFTGCDGNENNFISKEQCLSECSYGYLNTGLLEYNTPCEAAPEILPQCIEPTSGEIFPEFLAEDQNSVWFFDIVGQICRPVRAECTNFHSTNRFGSLNECKSQCSPNMDIQKTEESTCPSMEECDLNCPYGRVISNNQCELCECINPCEGFYCDYLHQCVVENSKPTCRLKNKPGMCPELSLGQYLACENNCRNDADCESDFKCCQNDCSSLQCTKPNFDKDPVIEEFKIIVELNEGETLELPCKASGYPTPTITWYKKTQEITFDPNDDRITLSKDNSLIIRYVSEQDEAEYSCRASNSKGRDDIKQTRVIVNERVIIRIDPANPLFASDGEGRLSCITENGIVTDFRWMKNNQYLTNGAKYLMDRNNLWIKNVQSSDEGEYSCVAESHGVQVTKSVQLKTFQQEKKECEDRASYNNCRLVVMKRWCAKFAKYCCKTCKQAGFD